MTNPFEYREVMQAAMRYDEDRTVEQVVAAQEQRSKERARAAKNKSKMGPRASDVTTAPSMAPVPVAAMEELRAMLANVPTRPAPLDEVASTPDGEPERP